jgi:hypothetical protein
VSVECIIRRAPQTCRNYIAQEESPDLVLDGVGFVFVESQKNEGFVYKTGIIEEWCQECSTPVSGVIYTSVMSVVQSISKVSSK